MSEDFINHMRGVAGVLDALIMQEIRYIRTATSPIIVLRNINPPRLCNGTRLAVKKLMSNVIDATILNGKFQGEDVLIPRIPMILTDMPFNFKRLQFPIRLAFAMSINKAQGESLQVCELNLENPCFAHGQLYVACSRVGKPSDLYVLASEGKAKKKKHCVSKSFALNVKQINYGKIAFKIFQFYE